MCLANYQNKAECKYLEADTTDEFLRVREAKYQRIARSRRGALGTPRSGQASSIQADGASTQTNTQTRSGNYTRSLKGLHPYVFYPSESQT